MTQYKDKWAAGRRDRAGAGLLAYPVLMAADILLYDTDEVPVGEDQKQHVELARDIAERFNRLYGDLFVMPSRLHPRDRRAQSWASNDPAVRMSKSYCSHPAAMPFGVLDEPSEIRRAIARAVTDSGNEIRFSEEPAGRA